jgi:hypothetical protein
MRVPQETERRRNFDGSEHLSRGTAGKRELKEAAPP